MPPKDQITKMTQMGSYYIANKKLFHDDLKNPEVKNIKKNFKLLLKNKLKIKKNRLKFQIFFNFSVYLKIVVKN
jgi:hypothetical protein